MDIAIAVADADRAVPSGRNAVIAVAERDGAVRANAESWTFGFLICAIGPLTIATTPWMTGRTAAGQEW